MIAPVEYYGGIWTSGLEFHMLTILLREVVPLLTGLEFHMLTILLREVVPLLTGLEFHMLTILPREVVPLLSLSSLFWAVLAWRFYRCRDSSDCTSLLSEDIILGSCSSVNR